MYDVLMAFLFFLILIVLIVILYYADKAKTELKIASELLITLIAKTNEEQERTQLLQIKKHVDNARNYLEKIV